MKRIVLIGLICITSAVSFVNFSAGRVHVEVTEQEITLDIPDMENNKALSPFSNNVEKTNHIPILSIKGHNEDTVYVDFSPNAAMFVSSSKDKNIKLWDTKSGSLVKEFHTDYKYKKQVLFHPSGKYIAFEDYVNKVRKIRLVDIETEMIIGTYNGIRPFAFSHDGLTIGYTSSNKNQIEVANVSTGQVIYRLEKHGRTMASVAFGSTNNNLVSGSFSSVGNFNAFLGNVGLFNYKTGKIVSVLENRGANSVAFAPNGKLLATGSYNNRVKLYNGVTGKLIKELVYGKRDINLKITSISFAYGSSLLATTNDRYSNDHIKLWDTNAGTLFGKLYTLDKNADVGPAIFSRNGNLLIAGGDKIRIWDTSKYNEDLAQYVYKTLDKSNYIAFYEFTKKFYNKFDVVQKTYRDIYDAVNKENTLEAYEWYESVFQLSVDNSEDIKDHIDGYEWYQKHFAGDASSELTNVMKKLNTLRQEKYAKEYEEVKKENNLAVYEDYAYRHTYPKTDNLPDAVYAMHELAFRKAKDIDTLSAYNTFIYAYPFSDEVKKASELAYELEKEKYTNIGMMGFFGKDEKLNKQARKLLIKAKKILEEIVPNDEFVNRNSIGVYMVVDRMYRLAQEEFIDTDAVLKLMESDKLKIFKKKFKRKLEKRTYDIKRVSSNNPEDVIELRSDSTRYIFTEAPSIDKEMKAFYEREGEKAKDFVKKVRKESLDEMNKRKSFDEEKTLEFNKLYNKIVSEYKPKIIEVEELDLDDFERKNIVESNTQSNENTNSKSTKKQATKPKFDFYYENSDIRVGVQYRKTKDKILFTISQLNRSNSNNFAGGISISFPDIKDKNKIFNAEGIFGMTTDIYPINSKIWNRKLKKQISSEHLLLEGWSKKWKENEIKIIKFSVNTKDLKELKMNIRAILVKNKNEFILPLDGENDQQGYPIKSIVIDLTKIEEVSIKIQKLEDSCNGGNGEGCHNLGDTYLLAKGVEKDNKKAVQLYEKSCDGRYAQGCFMLGSLYESGTGVKQDYTKARELYRKATRLGDTRGYFQLGVMYEEGKGANQDYVKASELYEKACNLKYAEGCEKLKNIPSSDTSSSGNMIKSTVTNEETSSLIQSSSMKIINFFHPDDEADGLYIVSLEVGKQSKTYRLYCPKKVVRDITNNTYGKSRSIKDEDSITFADNMVLRKAYDKICGSSPQKPQYIIQKTSVSVTIKRKTTGNIRGISRNGDGFIAIRSGPGGKYKMIDKFYRNGEKVIISDSKGKWKGVVYGSGNCGIDLSKKKGQSYQGACKTGWVYGKYVTERK